MAWAEYRNVDPKDQMEAAQELRTDLRKRLADPVFYELIKREIESGMITPDTTFAAAHIFQLSNMQGIAGAYRDGIRKEAEGDILYHHLLETRYDIEDYARDLTSYHIYVIIIQTFGEVTSYMKWKNRPEFVQ